MSDAINAAIRQATAALRQELQYLKGEVSALKAKPRNIREQLDAIPGRRLMYGMAGSATFTTADEGKRGNPINMLVSQDGPFVATHYPIVMWAPSLPTNATNYLRWRPISSWPSDMGVPEQEVLLSPADDSIDISWELVDGGSQRNLQNMALNPGLLSTIGQLKELPVPTKFEVNTTIQFIPTYNQITFGGSTATTQGTLNVVFPGYRIVGTVHS